MEHSPRVLRAVQGTLVGGMPSWYWQDAWEAMPVMARILLDRRPLGEDVEKEWESLSDEELDDRAVQYEQEYPMSEWKQAAKDAITECDLQPRPVDDSQEAQSEAWFAAGDWHDRHPKLREIEVARKILANEEEGGDPERIRRQKALVARWEAAYAENQAKAKAKAEAEANAAQEAGEAEKPQEPGTAKA